ncbi:hypothetical protein B0T22DRAFT_438937 [Podospora appendiculata]|uniref:Uncharacterized protein n=1 Tax=Podospora appendiculata TaxID=314037 RepID=A0AAE1CB96_9PEZI|nr:hypothetical protein B0T22DRAFT_438937 [Podospora appendiculata]
MAPPKKAGKAAKADAQSSNTADNDPEVDLDSLDVPATAHFLFDPHPERFVEELAKVNKVILTSNLGKGKARDWGKDGLELPGWLIKGEDEPPGYEAATSSHGTVPGFAYDIVGRPLDWDRPEWLVELTMLLKDPDLRVEDMAHSEAAALYNRLVLGTQFVRDIASNFLDQLAWDEKKLFRNTIITTKQRELHFRQALVLEQTEATLLEEIHREKVAHDTVQDRLFWLARAHKACLTAEASHREADSLTLRIREMRTTSRRLRKMVEDAREHVDAMQEVIDDMMKQTRQYLRNYRRVPDEAAYSRLLPIVMEHWRKLEAEIDQTWIDAASDYAFLEENSRQEQSVRLRVMTGLEVLAPPSTIPASEFSPSETSASETSTSETLASETSASEISTSETSTSETPAIKTSASKIPHSKTPASKTVPSVASTSKTAPSVASTSRTAPSSICTSKSPLSMAAPVIVSSTMTGPLSKAAPVIVSSTRTSASTSKASTSSTPSGVDPPRVELPKFDLSSAGPQKRVEPKSSAPTKSGPPTVQPLGVESQSIEPFKFEPPQDAEASSAEPPSYESSHSSREFYSPHSPSEKCQHSPL